MATYADKGGGAFTVLDSVGRTALTSTGLGASGNTVTVAGLSNPYTLYWGTAGTGTFSAGATPAGSDGFCNTGWPNATAVASAVSSISLPNGKSFQFLYDSTTGLLNEIIYPSGGWVKYFWNVNSKSEIAYLSDSQGHPQACSYFYGLPAISTRQVSYDGVNVAEEQDFFYTTNWGSGSSTGWATKVTTVTTYDKVRGTSFQTTYTYTPFGIAPSPNVWSVIGTQVPVESQIKYQNWDGSVLRTVKKTWFDQYDLQSEQTTLDNGQTSQVTYCYAGGLNCAPPGVFSLLQEKDEYDFGQSTPARKTITNYQSFPHTAPPSRVYDRPCQTIVQDGGGNRVAETDYFYDGGTSLCGTPGTAATTGVPNLPLQTRDETNYGPTATTSRGNATTITKQCFVGSTSCTNAVTTSTYDETGQITSTTDACGNANCSDMPPTSNHTATYSYADNYDSNPSSSTNTYVTKITNALGQFSTFKYAYADGQLIQSTDPNGFVTSYLYNDPFRRPTETDRPDGGKTTLAYNDSPPSPTVTKSVMFNAWNSAYVTTVTIMDGMGHTTHTQLTTDPQGTVYTDTAYDGLGNVYSVSNPYRSGSDPTSSPGTTYYTYDALSRKRTETYPDGSVLTTAYCGPSTLVTDPTKRWRRSRVDGLGRLVEVDEPNAIGASVASTGCPSQGDPLWATSYTYNALDKLLSVVQNGNHNRSFAYDSLGRLTASTNPEVNTIKYTYDANSNVLTKTDYRNITTTYGYDPLNRELTRTYSNGDPPVTTAYDQPSCLGSMLACQNIGHRTSMTDGAGSEAWAYQILTGWPGFPSIWVHQRTITVGGNSVTKTSSTYSDVNGGIEAMNYPSAASFNYPAGQFNYARDTADRPDEVYGTASNGVGAYTSDGNPPTAGCHWNAVCYTPQGTIYYMGIGANSGLAYGVMINETYNSRLQPQRITAAPQSPNAGQLGNTIMDISYNYVDPVNGGNAGHVFSITNNLDPTRSQNFTYDQLNRITSAQTTSTYATSPSHCWGETYQYDNVSAPGGGAWGNLTQIAATTNSAYTGCLQESGFLATANGNNQLSSFNYDPAGNTLSDGIYTYTWDGESQLKSATSNGPTTNYLFDGDGRRVAKLNSSGVATKLYWYGTGSDALEETDGTGVTTNSNFNEYIFFGSARIARRDYQSNVFYYVGDHLGTARAIAEVPAGQSAATQCYDADLYPFGGERAYTNTSSNVYKFEGKERDAETGNDNFEAREYSNRFGRWLSADWSNVPVAVPYANLTNPQTLNLYSMVADDPESFADLDGHNCGPCTNDMGEDPEQNESQLSQSIHGPPTPPPPAQNLTVADVVKIIQQAQKSSSDPVTTAFAIFNNLGSNVSVTGAVLREALSKTGVTLEGAGADLISHADSVSKSGSSVTVTSTSDYSTKQNGNTLYVDKKLSFNVGAQGGLPALSNIKGLHADTAKHSGVTINQIAVAMHVYTKKENVPGVSLGVPVRSLAVTGSKFGFSDTLYSPIQ
jgi:RHS repeat-associated protein